MTYTDFPPQYAGSPILYGIALFSLTLLSASSLAFILALLNDIHRYGVVRKVLNTVPAASPRPLLSLLNAYRVIVAGLMLTIFIGAFPDTVVLFAWGEVKQDTMEILWQVDKFLDGMTIVPFVLSVVAQHWVSQSLPQRLAEVEQTPLSHPSMQMVMHQLKIAGAVCLISAGVTLGKALG